MNAPTIEPEGFEAHYKALVMAAFKLRGILAVCGESDGASTTTTAYSACTERQKAAAAQC